LYYLHQHADLGKPVVRSIIRQRSLNYNTSNGWSPIYSSE
jgi:hypothetical protein